MRYWGPFVVCSHVYTHTLSRQFAQDTRVDLAEGLGERHGNGDFSQGSFLTRSSSLILWKVNSEWIKDLNLRPKALKLLEENTSKHGRGRDLLKWLQELRGLIARTDRTVWENKTFCTAKEIIISKKDNPQDRRKILSNCKNDRLLISRIHK